MTRGPDRLLRQAIADLADEGRPTNLAGATIAAARRIRRRRTTCGALVAALAAAALLVTPSLLLNRPTPPPFARSGDPPVTVVTSPATRSATGDTAVALPGDWLIIAGTDRQSGVVLDRQQNRYVAIDREVIPAPTGTRAVLVDRTASMLQIAEIGGKAGPTVHVPGATQPQWSPDGRRLLLTRGSGFLIVDADTGAEKAHPVSSDYRCNDYCFFRWHRNGREVGLPLTDTAQQPPHSEDQPDAQRGMQLFDADTGAPTRFLPVKGAAHGTYVWSPDGNQVVVEGTSTENTADSRRRRETQIRDTHTGELRATLPYHPWQVWWATNELLFAQVDSARIVAFRPDGTVTEVIEVEGALAGRDSFILGPR